ncbi:brefeldin A-inhibited guanine nucleotide-exchange protein 3-like [Centruroides sculpturatus]|uniref:brefeldin A-inhibited guanine nucleotide-exchange protein 3-like n=1 Tax=Centruroides sculpturatus TaxID=218467 RepID=UPI000C6DFB60|nr:brefeldin A-inhibited guanine nucleotide-exchange protein 3-like [Centruroides sculpturatus]
MENVLVRISKDATKHPVLRQMCLEVQEFLANQQGLTRAPSYEIREKCLVILQMALESKNNKLISHALYGFQKLVWDSLHSPFETDDDEKWLPCQLLKAIPSVLHSSEDTQIEILKILLQLAGTSSWHLSTNFVLKLISLCIELCSNDSSEVRTAAVATASQTIQFFCTVAQESEVGEEFKESENNFFSSCLKFSEYNLMDGVVEEVIPILEFLYEKLKNCNSSQNKYLPSFLLQCLLSSVSSLKLEVHKSQIFLEFLCILQLQIPCHLTYLQCMCALSPKLQFYNKFCFSVVSPEYFGYHFVLNVIDFIKYEFSIHFNFSIAGQLVRLVGSVGSLRPVLESLFHRMLLYPPLEHRTEALKAMKELMKKPSNVLQFAGPSLCDDDKITRSADLDLMRILMDSLRECCHSNDNAVCYASVSCMVAILTSLQSITSGKDVSEEYAQLINNMFKTLEDADFKGVQSAEYWHKKIENYNSAEKSDITFVDSNCNEELEINGNIEHPTVNTEDNSEEVTSNLKEENENSENNNTVEIESEETGEITKVEIIDDENFEEFVKQDDNSDNLEHISSECENITDDIQKELHESCSSTTTEGPEEGFDDDSTELDNELEEKQRILAEEEAARREKVPRTLLGKEDAGKTERERVERLCEARIEFAQKERSNARKFVKALKNLLPDILSIRSSIEADQAIQEFSSKYCEDSWKLQHDENDTNDDPYITIINADGIYLATYSSLLLNLKLLLINYYNEPLKVPPLTEQQFVDEVHGSGVLIYLSATWLAELYQQILTINLLETAGYSIYSTENSSLINLLTDIKAIGMDFPGDQYLSDYRRLERAATHTQNSPIIEAGIKFSRRVLTGCWDAALEILSVLLNGTNSCGVTGTLGLLLGTDGAKEEHRRAKDAIAESLDGLQRAAKLCNILGLQSRCGVVFSLLASVSCPLLQDEKFTSSKCDKHKIKKSVLIGKNKNLRLHTSHILSMDVILSRGLELGSHSSDCWKHVFSDCVEPASMPGTPLPPTVNIGELLMQGSPSKTNCDIIKGIHLHEVIEGLSQLVDRLFEDAANKLNLSALIEFLIELCAASQNQLFSKCCYKTNSYFSGNHGNALLLYRLGDVMLRCARGGRPLIHIMKAWSVTAPHFVEAACHQDRVISKKAVTTIHDIVSVLLSTHTELPYFHFNEALFKPFENLLCLELCDIDVQEQIISSICEFVEGCTTEIHSGWRPLFGALRAVRIPGGVNCTPTIEVEKEQARHLRVVLDVFEAFLRTNNVLVFAYAAVDCLLCLLKHVRGPAELEDNNNEEMTIVENVDNSVIPLDLCLAALKYLERCSAILASTFKMPACPVFNSANRIQLNKEPQCVDPVIPNKEIIYFKEEDNNNTESDIDDNCNNIGLPDILNEVMPNELDHPTGILRVWFLLLEGLAGAVATCPKKYQPHTMEMLFSMLHNLKEVPGPQFGIYCVNHLLLPMIQGWLRRTTRICQGWDNFANFKQCCGLSTDLVVDYVTLLAENEDISKTKGINLMLYQLLLVLTECISQPIETISRLGCACIRHIIISCGPTFTKELWRTACVCLQRAFSVSLHAVRQLMVCFHTDSENFYGDIGQVKVAVRRDCTLQEYERLQELAQQVFLLDCQRVENCEEKKEEERSYIFLLLPPNVNSTLNEEMNIIRVPFRNLVVGLLSHQILLQTISTLLLQGTRHILPSLATLLSSSSPFNHTNQKSTNISKLPGLLSSIPYNDLDILLQCLQKSFATACNFDVRPGLKFLIQKVAQIDVAANLYKQTGISWTIRALVLFELCLNIPDLTMEMSNNLVHVEDDDERRENGDDVCKREFLYDNPCRRLKDFFQDLCHIYTSLSSDKDGQIAAVDKIADQPIFFLTVQPDEFQDLWQNQRKSGEFSTDNATADNCSRSKIKKQDSVDSTDSEDFNYEKKDKVYTVATEKTIHSLVNEYKKRKTQHTMPSAAREKPKKKIEEKDKITNSNSVSKEIDLQRKTSIMKDSEARLQVWSQLIRSVLDLHLSLEDNQFKSLLPIVFPGICSLVVSSVDTELKSTLNGWMRRMAGCCGFYKPQQNRDISL